MHKLKNTLQEYLLVLALDFRRTLEIVHFLEEKDLCVLRITKIAHDLHVPTSTVQARLDKMCEIGVITGCTVLLDPEMVDRGFVAFIFGQAKLGEGVDLERPAKKLAKIPQVQEVFFITGDDDYLVKIRVKDREEHFKVVQEVASCFEVRGMGLIAPKCFKDTPKLFLG